MREEPTIPADRPPVRLSVVIPAHQAAEVLPLQLDALVAQEPGDHWEVVVVDNRSSDGTQALVARYEADHPRVRYVAAHEKPNVSYARNAGAAAARGRALAFVDADDVVSSGWVAAMDAALSEHDLVGGPLEYARLNPAWAAELRGPAQRDGFFHYPGGPPWPTVFAANLGVRKERHDAVGGFDERLPWGGEDADYVWRLRATGVTPYWAGAAVVHYRVRQDLRPLYRQSVGYARSWWELRSRYAESWAPMPTPMSRRRLARFALGRLARVRDRPSLAHLAFDLGWAVGDRAGSRVATGVDRACSEPRPSGRLEQLLGLAAEPAREPQRRAEQERRGDGAEAS